MSTKFVLGTTALLMSMRVAHADSKALLQEDESDQYSVLSHAGVTSGAEVMDQVGDKLSPKGRWGYVEHCFDGFSNRDLAEQAVGWAMCGEDLKALKWDDLKEGFGFSADHWHDKIDEWKKAGAKVEEEAKTDPGLLAILKLRDSAKADWKAFEAANHDAIVLYNKLKDGIRSQKGNDTHFDGCWDATQPAFAKLVKATKFHWDNDGDNAVQGRVDELVTNPASYYIVANFGMCAFSVHATGGVLASAAIQGGDGAPSGWRTMLASKLFDHTFKPKFANRSLSWGKSGPLTTLTGDGLTPISVPTPDGSMKIQTGMVKTMKKDGDDTAVTFKGIVAEECVDWKETNKIRTWDSAGNPQYERICLKRGHVEQDAPDDTTFGTKLIDGFAPGVGVAFITGFAEEVYNPKTKKFISILGVSVKGSPAETPIKE